MSSLTYDTVEVGDEIPSLRKPPISRATLALYAGASGDHNPIHIDIDFARSVGMPDVFAHGMLQMAYLGQALTDWVQQSALRSYGVRFEAITQVADVITCTGRITEKFEDGGEQRIRLELLAVNQDGDVKLKGEAIVGLS